MMALPCGLWMTMSQPASPPDILARIVVHKHHEVAAARRSHPLTQLREQLAARTVTGDAPLLRALRRPQLNVIAEVKRRSPSAGSIAAIHDPVALARAYAQGGAAAVSVLTDHEFFGGSIQDLEQVAPAIAPLPALRKDFMVDPYQFYEAAAAGAGIVLLIAAILEPAQAWEYHQLARSLGLETIFEIHGLEEYEPFDRYDWPIIGINNRNLRSFSTSLTTTLAVAPRLPTTACIVSESGFASFDDLAYVRTHVQGYLIGESLARHSDPAGQLQQWRERWHTHP